MSNVSRRYAGAVLAVLVGLASANCDTVDDLIPNSAGAFVVLRDASLGSQASAVATRQYVLWQVERMRLSIADFPDYSFLPAGACLIAATPFSDGSPATSCGGSAITLETTAGSIPAVVRVDVAGMETVSARRPSLPDEQDYDGDGVRNGNDNCKLVPNPGQEVFGDPSPFKPGIACSADDDAGDPTLPDQDNDGVLDSFDNCLWYPNPILPPDLSQADTNFNAIGDLCEVSAPIVLEPSGRLSLLCPGSVTITPGIRSTFVVDFTDALSCDTNFQVCDLDPTKVTMRLFSEPVASARPCVQVGDGL